MKTAITVSRPLILAAAIALASSSWLAPAHAAADPTSTRGQDQ